MANESRRASQNPTPAVVAKALHTLDHDGGQAAESGDELPPGYTTIRGVRQRIKRKTQSITLIHSATANGKIVMAVTPQNGAISRLR